MPLTPKNRKEEWLQGLVDHETTLTPKNRDEEWMKGLIDRNTDLPRQAARTMAAETMAATLDKVNRGGVKRWTTSFRS